MCVCKLHFMFTVRFLFTIFFFCWFSSGNVKFNFFFSILFCLLLLVLILLTVQRDACTQNHCNNNNKKKIEWKSEKQMVNKQTKLWIWCLRYEFFFLLLFLQHITDFEIILALYSTSLDIYCYIFLVSAFTQCAP